MSNRVVELDDGVTFPLTALSQLFVRESYVDMLDADDAYRARNTDLQLTYVTGTPGIVRFQYTVCKFLD